MSYFGLSAAEFAQMEREVGDGPGDEIAPIGPLLARFIVNGVRANNAMAMKWFDEILAKDGVPRFARKAHIHKLKAAGPVQAADIRSADDFLQFLRGLAT